MDRTFSRLAHSVYSANGQEKVVSPSSQRPYLLRQRQSSWSDGETDFDFGLEDRQDLCKVADCGWISCGAARLNL